MEQLSPLSAVLGGALIGLASALLMFAQGRVTGISGVAGGALKRLPGDRAWRYAFLAALLLSGAVLYPGFPELFDTTGVPDLPTIALAGVLVGYGTRLGNGCTSGHGVCGVGRLSRRSLVATAVFMLTGGLTVLLMRHGGTP